MRGKNTFGQWVRMDNVNLIKGKKVKNICNTLCGIL
jgi:hypothetical protein